MKSEMLTQIKERIGDAATKVWGELCIKPKLDTEEIDGEKVTVLTLNEYRAEIRHEEKEGNFPFTSMPIKAMSIERRRGSSLKIGW